MSQLDVEKLLEKFVIHFVELFESYFSEYHRRLIEKSPNAGGFVRFFEETVGISKSGGEVLEDVSKASTLIALDLIVKIVKAKSSQDNWSKLKELAPKLLKFGADGHFYRGDLIKGAGNIFEHFEAQFMDMASDSGWEYAIRKIAKDAVNRVISYLRNLDAEIDLDSIIKGVVYGQSKRYTNYLGLPNWHKGHSIRLHGRDITTSKLFENLGVISNGQYFVPKVNKHKLPFDHKAWFRLAFKWESVADTHDLANPLPDGHTYELNEAKLLEKLKSIKETIDEAPNPGITAEELEEIGNDVKQRVESVVNILKSHHEHLLQTLNIVKVELQSLKEQSANTEKIARETQDAAVVIKELTLEIRDELRGGRVQEKPPIWFIVKPLAPMFTGREGELKDLDELVFRDVTSSLSRITVVSGLGGVGKTQLALKYAHKHRELFTDVVWLNAENENTLGKSFVDLAKDGCGISTIDSNGKEMAVLAVVQKVNRYFIDRPNRTLMIFDNAEKSCDLLEYLPINSSETGNQSQQGTTHILITSREREWSVKYPDIKEFKLREFNADDSVDFVRKCLSVRPADDKDIKELVETLQRLPLALEQAVAYINDANVTEEYSVAAYLEDYNKMTRELLDSEVFKGFLKSYDNTTYATWNMTIDKISKQRPLAEKIIYITSFLAPNDIPREIFYRLKNVSESEVKEAVRLIVKYSMMNEEDGPKVLSVHRLVQEVMRLQLLKSNHFDTYLDAAVLLMGCWCSFDEPKLEELSRYLKFTPSHIEALVGHLTSAEEQRRNNDQKDVSYLVKLRKALGWLAEIYHFKHDFQRLQNVLVRVIEIHDKLIEQSSNKNPFSLLFSKADTLLDVSDVYFELENYPEALTARAKALEIFEQLGDQTLMAETHSKIADVYRVTSQMTESRNHYRKALEILDGHEKGNDRHVVINKLSICFSLWLVDDGKNTVELLEQNLKYWEQDIPYMQGMDKMGYIFTPKQLLDLGEAYMKIGKKETAKKLFSMSMELCEKYEQDLFYARMIAMMNYFNVRDNLGVNLQINLENSLKILRETQGAQHIETVKLIINFAGYYFMMGLTEKGFRLMEEALDLARLNHYDIQSEILVQLGRRYNHIGEFAKALEVAREGLSILESRHGESSMKLFGALETLALIQANSGDKKQDHYYERLLRITEEHCEEGDYRLAWVQVRFGKSLSLFSRDEMKSKELISEGMSALVNHFGTEERAEAATSTYLIIFN